MLLPDVCLVRRRDAVEVIGEAVLAAVIIKGKARPYCSAASITAR